MLGPLTLGALYRVSAKFERSHSFHLGWGRWCTRFWLDFTPRLAAEASNTSRESSGGDEENPDLRHHLPAPLRPWQARAGATIFCSKSPRRQHSNSAWPSQPGYLAWLALVLAVDTVSSVSLEPLAFYLATAMCRAFTQWRSTAA